MTTRDWNESYATGDLPWDSGTPDPHLVEFVFAMAGRGSALDVGCGTGTNAVWLARQGFDVLGVDVSPIAIERARGRLGDAPLQCSFEVADLIDEGLPGGPYDLVFDRGCFHVFDEAEERACFARRVAAALRPGGLWLSLVGSTEGPLCAVGPPRRSLRDIALAIEPELELVQVRATEFHVEVDERAAAWMCVSRRRSLPAQPSTRH